MSRTYRQYQNVKYHDGKYIDLYFFSTKAPKWFRKILNKRFRLRVKMLDREPPVRPEDAAWLYW